MIHGIFQEEKYISILNVSKISWTSGSASCNRIESCWLSFVTSAAFVRFKPRLPIFFCIFSDQGPFSLAGGTEDISGIPFPISYSHC